MKLIDKDALVAEIDKEIQTQWKGCEPIDEGMGCEFANISVEQFDSIAKHFFELGMQQSKNYNNNGE